MQYQTQKSSAYIPSERNLGERYPLVPHTNKQISFFGVEQYRWNDFIFELGMRTEKQSTPVHYDFERLAPYLKDDVEQPDLTTYKESAFSYSSSVEWLFDDVHRLSFMYSHNERLPSPMELYYHGKHLATSSFMFGNKNLTKEQSDNFEIGIARETGKLDYKLSLYHNKFDNYIHNENLWREGNLFMRRYTQSKAKFYGAEGEISYSFVPEHKITLFGDVITGKVSNLPKIIGRKIYSDKVETYVDEEGLDQERYIVIGQEVIMKPDRRPPRLPPARLGIRMNSQFGENWSVSAEYTHVFKQEKVAISVSSKREKEERDENKPLLPVYIKENVTKGYHLVNLGVDYNNKWNNVDYKISLNANNLLNEKIHIHTSYLQFVPQMGRNFVLGLNVSF